MQFYNYATRVLLDDLSNIIRCCSIRIVIIIKSSSRYDRHQPLLGFSLSPHNSCSNWRQHYHCNSGQLANSSSMLLKSTHFNLHCLSGPQTEAARGGIWSLTRTCCERLRTSGWRCRSDSDSMPEMSFPGSAVLKMRTAEPRWSHWR